MALYFRWVSLLGVFAVLLGGQAVLNRKISFSEAAWVELPSVSYEVANPELFKVLMFGHLPVAVDWLWIRTLADPAISHVAEGTHPPNYYDLMLASQLDPAFFELHFLGATILSVIRDDASGARDLLERAQDYRKNVLPTMPEAFREEYWSSEWQVPWTLGYVYLFELEDIPRAAKAYQEASEFPNAPVYLRRLASRLSTTRGQFEIGLRYLRAMEARLKDAAPEVRNRVVARFNSLSINYFLFDLNEKFREFLNEDPFYRKLKKVRKKDLQSYWARFRRMKGIGPYDPAGGRLFIDEKSGKIESETSRQKTLGIE